VIDSIANDQQELLRQLDGRQVVTATGPVTLRTAEARVVELPMSLPARALQLLADPNIAYLLFILGVIGIIAELYSPGTLFPGIVGAIALVLAFVGFGTLPVNWAGVLLLLLAIGLFVAELVAEGFGLLAVGGLIAFVLASLILYSPVAPTSPAMPSVGVSPWLIGGMAAGIAACFLLVGRAALESTRAPVATGAEALRGRVGVAVSDLAPSGTARVDGELWNAVAEEAPIRAGEEVQIVGVDGIRLQVRRRG
jgi:membrane-bound serine protease (ClpP class)